MSIGSSNEIPAMQSDNIFGHYVRSLSLLNRVITWVYVQRHRAEKLAPWSHDSNWQSLLRQALSINKGLQGRSQLTSFNISAHSRGSTAAQYFNMHIARLLCHVFLHWEFLPFLPLNCGQPGGPNPEPYDYFRALEAPPGFWTNSARACSSAARSILDLTSDSREETSLPTNAFAAYGVFVAKFIQVYALSFPWMDVDNLMTPLSVRPSPHAENESAHYLGVRSYSFETQNAGKIVAPALQWAETLDSISNYFRTFKKDFAANIAACATGGYRLTTCLREGGDGEGREEYELFRHRLSDFCEL